MVATGANLDTFSGVCYRPAEVAELAQGMNWRADCAHNQALICPGNNTLTDTANQVATAESCPLSTGFCSHAIRLALVVMVALLGLSSRAYAQMDGELDDAVKKLTSDSTSDQQAGRDAIIAMAGRYRDGAPAFNFAQGLNSRLQQVTRNQNVRVRLNAAIAVKRSLDLIKGGDQLFPVVVSLTKDSNEGVTLWAVRATSRFVDGPKQQEAIDAIVEAAKRFPALTATAYESFKTDKANVAAPLISAVQSLLAERIASYGSGVPADPLADTVGGNLLVDTKWWQSQNAAQQMRTAQLISDYAGVLQQVVVDPKFESALPELRDLAGRVKLGAQALGVLKRSDSLQNAMKAINITRYATTQEIAASMGQIVTALKAEYSGLTAPPSISATPGGPATSRTSAP